MMIAYPSLEMELLEMCSRQWKTVEQMRLALNINICFVQRILSTLS